MDLNRADLTELLQMPDVGNNLAARILAYRRQHGPFKSVNDLRHVSGIGPTTLERLRPWLCVPERETDRPTEPHQKISPPPSTVTRRSAEPEGRKQSPKPAGKKERQLAEPIDLNQATETELQRLPGIGPRRAQLIIGEREKRPFASLDELRRVPGIGPKTLEKLRPYITVEPAPPRTPRQVNPELRSERSVERVEPVEQKRTA
jgi:competence protein ComEA